MSGRLDGQGFASVKLKVPPDPALHEFTFHAAAVTLDGASFASITNPFELRIVR